MHAQQLGGDPDLGATGELRHLAQLDPGDVRERAPVERAAEAAEVDEGQVDVPQDQAMGSRHEDDRTGTEFTIR